ncbi:MAG: helix-turn-helix transcriptional regulator [Bacteroidales bacterium]|nr:helix-turn-helix transcriptional regulator [Bacteroidales bacterium]
MDERSIKAAIKALREELGVTQEIFAESLGMDISTYWRLEDGDTRIVNRNIYRMAEKTGRSVEEIMLGKSGLLELREESRNEEQIKVLKEHYETVISNLNDYIRMLKEQLAEK